MTSAFDPFSTELGGGPSLVVSTAAFHARFRGSVPGVGGLKETKMFLPHPRVKLSIVGSLRDREVAWSVSDRQGSYFESCVWRTVSSWSVLMTSAFDPFSTELGGGPSLVVSTAAFHARFRGSVPGVGGLKETKMFLPHPRVKLSIVGSLRDREVACSVSDRQGSYFESCVWRTVSSHSSHHLQEVQDPGPV